MCLSTFTFSHPNFTSLSPRLPPPLCFLALNSSVQAGRGLIVAQAHNQPNKGCVSDGKGAPARVTASLLGSSHLGPLFTSTAPSLVHFLLKIKNLGVKYPKVTAPPVTFNGQHRTEPNVALTPQQQPQPEPPARH